MTTLTLTEVGDDRLGPLSFCFEPGLWVVVSDEPGPLVRLFDIAGGARRPRRGAALLGGQTLHTTPKARQKLGALLAAEELVPAATVRESIRLASSLRGAADRAEATLETWGLASLLDEDPRRLDTTDRRTVAFALALSGSPEAVVLSDPFALAGRLDAARIRDACWDLAQSAVVLVGTLTLRDAAELGGDVVLLERGRFVDVTLLARSGPHELLVRSAGSARLAELLAARSELNVGFDPRRSPRELFVRGANHARMAREVLRAARDAGIEIEALAPLGALGAPA